MSAIDFTRVRTFLDQHALPFWSTTCTYENGCFVEQLDMSGKPVDPGFTRIRVQARQIYVFSHVQHVGLFASATHAEKAANFFMTHGWLGEDRGWARRITRTGELVDDTYDLYDVAFALFALGWYYRISGDKACLELAHKTLNFLEAKWAHPLGGFYNDATKALPRQQNPHMHLIESMNIWLEATGESRFAEWSQTIIDLFENKFTDRDGNLFEFFSEDWTRHPSAQGNIVEPGHQFEWAWIIGHNGRLTGNRRDELVRRVIASALRSGYDPQTGLTVDQVDGSGAILAASKRLWPQTEAIKAALAEFEFLGVDTRDRIGSIVDGLFRHFLDTAPVPGTWIDHYDAEWKPLVDKIPTSSLYHITLAFMELLRLQPALERR